MLLFSNKLQKSKTFALPETLAEVNAAVLIDYYQNKKESLLMDDCFVLLFSFLKQDYGAYPRNRDIAKTKRGERVKES